MEKKIKRLYLNPKFKGSFSGLNTFPKALGKQYDKQVILRGLQGILTYAQNRTAIHKFRRRKVIVHGIQEQFVMDLIDISKRSKDNNNNKFLLTVIDAFSKFAWVRPIKTKTASTFLTAFQDIFKKSKRIPKFCSGKQRPLIS